MSWSWVLLLCGWLSCFSNPCGFSKGAWGYGRLLCGCRSCFGGTFGSAKDACFLRPAGREQGRCPCTLGGALPLHPAKGQSALSTPFFLLLCCLSFIGGDSPSNNNVSGLNYSLYSFSPYSLYSPYTAYTPSTLTATAGSHTRATHAFASKNPP